jgi:hypothetical protein
LVIVERDDFGAPRVPPVELEGAKLGDIDSVVRLKLVERTDHQTRAGFDVEASAGEA